MSTQIYIVPSDLRYAASAYLSAGASLNDVRIGLATPPPLLPGDLAGKLGEQLGRTWLDISEQLAYIAAEAGSLKRRAQLIEEGDDGTNVLNEIALGRVPTLGERFEMPKPKKHKKGAWEKGVPGFFAGVGSNLWGTVRGLAELASLQMRPQAAGEFGLGIWYAIHHPDQTFDAFIADIIDKKDWDAGNYSKATGYVLTEAALWGLPFLKAAKLRSLAKAADAAKVSRDAALGDSAFAEARALAAQQRMAAGPRWEKWDALAQGKEAGSWKDPLEFHVSVVNPADQEAVAAGRAAVAAQRAYDLAHQKYERLDGSIEPASKVYDASDRAALLDRIIEDLNKRRAQEPRTGGGGSW